MNRAHPPRARHRTAGAGVLAALLAAALLLAACSSPGRGSDVHYDDVDIDTVTAPASSARAARIYLDAGEGTADGEPLVVGWINDDPAWDASLLAAVRLVNLELDGVNGRPVDITACRRGEDGDRCAARIAEEGPALFLIGRTDTAYDDLRATMADTPAVGVESDDPRAWADPHTRFYNLNTPGVLRAASIWAGGQGYGKALVLAPNREALDATLGGLGPVRVAHLVLPPDEAVGAQDRIARAISDLAGRDGTGRIVVINALDQDGCVSLARAVADPEPSWGDVDVVTTGNCAGKRVHSELGDWPPEWYHVGSGPNLQNYELEPQVRVYRDRLVHYAGPDADWTAANTLPFGTLLTALRIIAPTVAPTGTPQPGTVDEALSDYRGPGYMGMPSHRCGYDPERPALCVDLARIYLYTGQRDWRNLSGDPFPVHP